MTPAESIISTLLREYWHVMAGFLGGVWALAVAFGDIKGLKSAHKDLCKKAEEDLKESENRLGLRMTAIETNQDKLQELIYREMKSISNEISSVNNLVQDVRASVKETEGYLRAQREINEKHPTRRG